MPDLSRYQRQTILPFVGEEGQRRLASSHAVIVGVGALGCHSADLLARAGVGRITLIDRDVVERTNLQRQSLFTERDADGHVPKAVAAADRLRAANSDITIDAHVADLTSRNSERLLSGADVLVDGTDNFETRFLLNDAAVKHAIPFSYAGVVGVSAMWATFLPGRACFRCVLDEPPDPGAVETCDTAGVLGAAVTLAAAGQVVDVLKVLLGHASEIPPMMHRLNVWTGAPSRIEFRQSPGCPCCGERRFEFLNGRGSETSVLCGQNAVQVHPERSGNVDLEALAARIRTIGAVSVSRFILRVAVPPHELTLFADGRAVVKGTREPGEARAVYARLLG